LLLLGTYTDLQIQECTGNLFGLDTGNEHVGEGTSEGKEDPHVQAGNIIVELAWNSVRLPNTPTYGCANYNAADGDFLLLQECTGNLFGLDNGNEHVGEGTSEGKEDPHVQAGIR
jgi:hypothetical protein